MLKQLVDNIQPETMNKLAQVIINDSLLAASRLVGKLKVKTNNNSTLLKIRPWYAHVHTTLSCHHMLFRENTHMQKLQIQICFYG